LRGVKCIYKLIIIIDIFIIINIIDSWGPDAYLLVSDLGRRIAAVMGEPRSAALPRQLIDIALHLQYLNLSSIAGATIDRSQ